MTSITLNRDEWLAIDPEFRAIVDHTPHAFVYDEDRNRLQLMPVTIMEPPRYRRHGMRTTREFQPA